jgi:hypothetical protein
MRTPRALIVGLLALTWVTLTWGFAHAAEGPGGRNAESIVLVADNTALFRIIVAEREDMEYEPEQWARKLPPDWLYFAAADLARYVYRSTGAEPDVITDPARAKQLLAEEDGVVNVHLGMTEYVKTLDLDLPKPHGFVIKFPSPNNIVIAGVPIQGRGYNTMYGVHHFLREHLGIRWLFPGELGEYVPTMDTLQVPVEDVYEVPDFPMRGASGWGKVYGSGHPNRWAGVYWYMRTGGTHSVVLKYNHNIGNIIDPEQYGDTHPEFFPILDGERFIPGPEMKHAKGYVSGWEPCYSADGIAEAAASTIIEYFDQNPDASSYSLAVNDGIRICECSECRQANLPINEQIPENEGLDPDDPGFVHTYQSQTYYAWVNEVVERVRRAYPDRYFGLLGYSRVSIPPQNIQLDDHIVPVLAWDLNYFDDPLAREKSEANVDRWNAVAGTLGWWDYTFEGSYLIPPFYAHSVADTLKYLHGRGLRFYYDELHAGRHFKNAPQEYMKRRLLWDITQDADELLDEWYRLAVGERAAPYMAEYFDLWEEYWTTRIMHTDWYRERVDGSFVAPYLDRRFCGYMDELTRDDLSTAQQLLETAVNLAETQQQKKRARFFHDYYAKAMTSYFLPYISYVELGKDEVQMQSREVLYHYDFDEPRPGKNPRYQGWGNWKREGSTAVAAPSDNGGRNDTGCLLFHNSDSSVLSGLVFTKNFPPLEPGKTYRFSGWYRVDAKTPSRERVSLNLWFYTEAGLLGNVRGSKGSFRFRERDEVNDEDLGQWKELSIAFTVPEGGWEDLSRIYCFITAERAPLGTKFWFDDFSVTEVEVAG